MEITDKFIRRLRKKLQQIENLELLRRPLNDEELCKVAKKDLFRAELAKLLNHTTVKLDKNNENNKPDKIDQSASIDLKNPLSSEPAEIEMKRVNDKPTETPPNEIKKPRPKIEAKSKEDVPVEDNNVGCFPSNATSFWLHNFSGHSDIVTSVALDETFLVSASRDTSIKVWNLRNGQEQTTLRGHSNFVSSVVLVPRESLPYFSEYSAGSTDRLLISASLDCCVKLWDISSGETLRSIYTFNGVTSLEHVPGTACCAIGTEGGKLEIYDLSSEANSPVWSATAFSDTVSCLKVIKDRLYSASLDGTMAVWALALEPEKVSAKPIYRTEDLSSAHAIRCMTISANGDVIYYGGEGSNLKALHWRTGKTEKLANHPNGPGITNAVSSSECVLVSSSFDIATGIASINVRRSCDEKYVYTLDPGEPNRILSIAVLENSSRDVLYIVTGGTELYVWEAKNPTGKIKSEFSRTVNPLCLEKLSFPAEDTEVSDESESDSETDDPAEENDQSERGSVKKSSWCSVM